MELKFWILVFFALGLVIVFWGSFVSGLSIFLYENSLFFLALLLILIYAKTYGQN